MVRGEIELPSKRSNPTAFALGRAARRLPAPGSGDATTSSALPRPNDVPLLAVLVTLCALATLLSILVTGPNTLAGDLSVGRWIQRLHSAPLDVVAWIGNFIGEGKIVFTAAVAMMLYAFSLRLWRDLRFLLLLVVLRLASLVQKDLFESPRPTSDQLRLAEAYEHFGFPSGHAMSATILAGAFIVLALRRVQAPTTRRVAVAACLLIPVMTGFARVYVGAHWPSDVLGGYLWGAAIVVLAVILSRRIPLPRQSVGVNRRAA